jgi:hypothetical protein
MRRGGVVAGDLGFNAAVRGGIAALFLGRAGVAATALFFRLRGGCIQPEPIARGLLMLRHGYVVSGVLVGVGALWFGGVPGFLVAYAAFSIAWFWWFI